MATMAFASAVACAAPGARQLTPSRLPPTSARSGALGFGVDRFHEPFFPAMLSPHALGTDGNIDCDSPLSAPEWSVKCRDFDKVELPACQLNFRLAASSDVIKRCVVKIRAAKKGPPSIMPAVMSPSGPTDLSTLLLKNRVVFVGSPVNSQVSQRVISQLLTLAAIDEDEEIQMYINCPGGSTYSVLAIYDTMAWIKPKVSTVCFGIAASQGALLLAGGEKGRRFAMPNARIMIHQPQGGCGGTADDVRRQVNEIMQSRDKIDKMYVAFTGQPLERVQQFTDRDRFFASSEAMEFGLIDGLLETEY